MSSRIFLVEFDGYDPDTETVITHRFCSGEGYQSGPDWYEPRLKQPATFSRSINTSELGGRQSISYGETLLSNDDGELDFLADDYFDGREMRVYYGRPSDPRERFVMILRAQMAAVAVEVKQVSIRLRDRAITLDKPFSTAKYGGTNILPAGVDGTPDDIKDQSRPVIFGRVALMEPVLVNTSLLIYQVNDGYAEIVNVFDGGAYLARETEDYASEAELTDETNEPRPGYYKVWPAGGYVRLGGRPFSTVSVSCVDSWNASEISAAGLLRRILERAAEQRPDTLQPRTAADWHYFDLKQLDEDNAASLGVVVQPDETTLSLLDRICATVGAFWGFDALGALRVIRFEEPSATADLTLDVYEMLEAEREPESQVPYWRVTVRADQNFAVQDRTGLAGVVPADRSAWLGNPFRDSKAEDTDIQTTRLLAEEVTYESLLNGIGPAEAEAERRLGLFSVRRDVVTLTLPQPSFYGDSLDLGKTAKVIIPRLGYQSGKNMTIIGLSVDYANDRCDVTLWG